MKQLGRPLCGETSFWRISKSGYIGRKRERLRRPFQVPSGPFALAERQSKLRKLQRPQAQ